MGKLTTHVLDAAHGVPAEGVAIQLLRQNENRLETLYEGMTNSDGRTPDPLLEGAAFAQGIYTLEFHIGDYFRQKLRLPETPFLDIVPIRFGVNDLDAHYHVPLLASPYAYSTYRGS